MKKYLMTAMILLAVSCSKGDEKSLFTTGGLVYTAYMESSDTKVFVDGSLITLWNEDDRISIFNTTYNSQYRFLGETGADNGTFTEVEHIYNTGAEIPTTYAVYPYSSETSVSPSGELTVNLPAVQYYAPDSYGPGANTMVAATQTPTSTSLLFRNLCGFLVFDFYGNETIKSITLEGNDDEIIAGPGTVSPVFGEVPSLEMSEAGTWLIKLDCGEGVRLGQTPRTATSFWMAVPPVTFEKGFTVTVTNTEGMSMVRSVSAQRTITRNVKNSMEVMEAVCDTLIGNVEFEDEVFKCWCVERFDTDGDGEISMDEAYVVTEISCSNYGISSLKGIEQFTNLTYLDCSNNCCETLDVSRNTQLTHLACHDNQLTVLDVSHNIALETLYCSGNPLTTLDVSQNIALETLCCYENQLTALDVSQNKALKSLWCDRNQLTALDVTQNDALTYLICSQNPLTVLDVSHNNAITSLVCADNQLTALDVSQNTALTELQCENNLLSSLDVSHNSSLSYLICTQNPFLSEIWLMEGQYIHYFDYDSDISTIKYRSAE